ncbi:MAG: Gfo/Idh/MocA family oxidoreductase [Candidatus Pacebacteria bacterium]|nr:Gfo/Idh/MocA family oxidoreductase [Candidatus Paceibacterota bacterium]
MMSSQRVLRIGLVGLGRIGKKHGQTLAWETRHCQLVAACSPIESEQDYAINELGLDSYYDNYQKLLNDKKVEAVVLATPTNLHAEQTIMALQSGKHVFVEKPLALNLQDCLRVEAVAKNHPQLVAMVGFVRRFDPSYREAKLMIEQGQIGSPYLIRSQTCDLYDPTGFFVNFAPTSGGIFMDCSVHDIDLARWLMGVNRARRVFATGLTAIHHELMHYKDVDNGIAVIEFEGDGLGNEARAVITASRTWQIGHETSSEVIGTGGKLLIGAGAARDRVEIGDGSGIRKLAVSDFHQRFDQAFKIEIQAFVDACLGLAPLSLSIEDATEATRIGLAITQSLHSGEPVSL